MSVPSSIRVSEEEYFALLQESTEKLEYHDGEILAMAFRRTEANEWLLHDYLPQDKTVQIGTCELLMEDIYRKVGFEIS